MLDNRVFDVLKSRTISGDGVRFILAGSLNTFLTLALYQALLLFINHQFAYAVSWIFGIAYLIVVYPSKVFSGSCLSWYKYTLMICVYILVFFLGLRALDLFVDAIGSPRIAIFFVMLTTTTANFLLMRLVFRAQSSRSLREEKKQRVFSSLISCVQSTSINLSMKYSSNLFSNNSFYRYSIFLVSYTILSYGILLIKHGVDIPFYDDWRLLYTGEAGSFSPKVLFTHANDTLYATGRILDAFSFHILKYNNIAYQLISMIFVLSGLVWIKYKLLIYFTADKLLLSLSIMLMLFMLQAGTYWGFQSIAYHQALPLLSILSILYIIITKPIKNGYKKNIIILAVGLFGGLAYISGAVSLFVMTIWLYMLTPFMPAPIKNNYSNSGIGLLLATIITLPLQLHVILIKQGGNTHRADSPWAMPNDSDFWCYFLGKFARAIGFLLNSSMLAFTLSVIFIIVLLTSSVYLFYMAYIKNSLQDIKKFELFFIFSTLSLVVFAYVAIVAAGRANLRPPTVNSPLSIFAHGQRGFHFYWITLLIPWLGLIIGGAIKTLLPIKNKSILTSLIIFIPIYITMRGGFFYLVEYNNGGAFNHSAYLKEVGIMKSQGVLCIHKKAISGDNKIICPQLLPGPRGLRASLSFSKLNDLSFTRSLSHISK